MRNLMTALLIAGALSLPWACSRTFNGPGSPSGPTATPTISAPTTIMVSIVGSYMYQASGGSYDSVTGALDLNAHVGDTIIVPNITGFHPLFFDNGSSTCVYDGNGDAATSFTYIFPATGIYHFHCGIHSGCGFACGASSCTGLAAVVTVQ